MNAKEKKETQFRERISKLYKNYNEKKEQFYNTMIKYDEWVMNRKQTDKQGSKLPLKILKHKYF